MALVAAASFLLLIVSVAAFNFVIYLGSSRELRHTVDAAVLNVSKRAVENKVSCTMPVGYDDCADSTKQVGLTNINRVWGKCYLVNANEEQMIKTGLDAGTGANHALQAQNNAQSINDNLYNLLIAKYAADSHFKQIAQNKPAKLLGSRGDILTDKSSSWDFAWSYPGEESNIVVDTQAFPSGETPFTMQYKGGPIFLQGYRPNKVNSQTICFTTFHTNESPHLISDSAFAQARVKISGTVNAIPNTFKDSGQINNSQVPISATACAVANPMRSYNLAVPHSFLTLGIENLALWTVQGMPYPVNRYFPGTGKVWGIKNYKIKKPGAGLEDGYASLGNEYDGTLWQAINALEDHPDVINKMLQRIKEFCPFYTAKQFQKLLQTTPYNMGETTWYFYPVHNQPDLSDPQVAVTANADALPGWLQGHTGDPEGQPALIATEPQQGSANFCWSNIRNGPYTKDKHSTGEFGEITWQPGTGWFDGSTYYALGHVQIKRTSTSVFTALP
jgi:hypothetical protein